MHPAFSILFFTTLAGAAQGLIVALAVALLCGVPMGREFFLQALALGEVLLVAGLVASFFHLGHKMRAWRAVLMWRTSWMSREVIVMPAFIGLVAVWWLALALHVQGFVMQVLPVVVIVGALVLWYCTAMIYACLRFIREWAHPLTVWNFVLIGLSSGAVLACALAASHNELALLALAGPSALGLTLLAGAVRWLSLRRNASLVPVSTLQSATGISAKHLVQKSMGMSAGAFNTREFFHGASLAVVKNTKWFFIVGLFVAPALMALWAITQNTPSLWLAIAFLQASALIPERWFFFAQAQHPQNLYYQTVS
jgi:DMSO reductase anchor subunit